MGKPDYYQYYLELTTHDEVVFPHQHMLIDFVANFIAEEYKSYLIQAMVSAINTMEDIDRYMQRENSEPALVEIYVKSYISKKFAQMDTLANRLRAKVKRQSWPLDIRFDAKDNTEMFEYVLGRLKQGDMVKKVFTSGYAYTIVEGKKLVREYI